MGTATNVTISDVILPPLTSGAEVNINKWLANQSGKVVVLGIGKGTFNITGSIIVPSGTTLQGQGWDTKIYRTTSSYVSLAAEALDDAETGFDVDNGAEFTPGQTIRVDSEDMYISSIASNTLIVIRGHNGTTAAAHADDAAILSNGPVIVNAASMEGTSSAIAIRNLWVDAGDLDADVTQPSSTGIVLRKCDNSVVEGCWVQNCQGSHPTDTDMDVLRGNGIAVDDSDKCLIAKNYVTLTSHGGISIRTNSNYNRVVLNKVWNSQYEGIIIGNKTNVYPAANSSTGQGCSYNTIEQNMVWDNGLNTSYQKSYDIYIEDQATTGAGNPHLNNAIINNTIKYSAAFGSVADGTGTLGSSPTTLYATSANTVAVSTAGTFTVTLPTGVFAKVESGATWVVTDSPKVVTTGQTFTVEAGGSGNISITLCGLTNGITIWRGASTTATTQSTLIANNTIEGVQGNGIAVYNSHGDTITGNNVSNVRSVGYLGDGAYKQSVLGNRFVGQYGAGLSVNTCPDISVKDNIFTCPTDNGVLIYTGTSDAAVQNNKITILDSKTGILVQGATTDRPQITGNNITMTATGGSGLGIHLATSSGCDDGLIANNSITNLNASGTPNAKGIYVNSDRVTSTGNIIESTTPANGFIYAINYETTAQGGIISGNQLTNSFRAAGKAIHDENVTSPLTQVYGNVGWIAPGEIRTFTKAITAGVQDTVTSMQNTSGSNLLITEVIIKLTVAASASNPTYDCGMDDDGAGAPATNDFFEAIPDTVGVYSSVHTETYGTQTVPVSWPTSGNDWVNFIITDAAGADTVGTIYIKAMGA
jgi:parallel beta-helix repeat protein